MRFLIRSGFSREVKSFNEAQRQFFFFSFCERHVDLFFLSPAVNQAFFSCDQGTATPGNCPLFVFFKSSSPFRGRVQQLLRTGQKVPHHPSRFQSCERIHSSTAFPQISGGRFHTLTVELFPFTVRVVLPSSRRLKVSKLFGMPTFYRQQNPSPPSQRSVCLFFFFRQMKNAWFPVSPGADGNLPGPDKKIFL